jgi:DNA-binding IclR family transcriptional regulator
MAQVPAGAHTLRLLTNLAQQATPVAAASMSRDLALPRSTTYHLRGTMIDAGYVTHYPDQQVYGLGLSA